jgi:hypothetical protein
MARRLSVVFKPGVVYDVVVDHEHDLSSHQPTTFPFHLARPTRRVWDDAQVERDHLQGLQMIREVDVDCHLKTLTWVLDI